MTRDSPRGSLMSLIQSLPLFNPLVTPFCWGRTHAKLLGITFKKRSPVEHPTPVNKPGSEPSEGHLRPSATISELNHSLSELLEPNSTDPDPPPCVRSVLSLLWPNAFGKAEQEPKLDLTFGNRSYHDAVRVQLMWNYPDFADNVGSHNPANLPMVCFVDAEAVSRFQRSQPLALAEPSRPVYLAVSSLLWPRNTFYDTAAYLCRLYTAHPDARQRNRRVYRIAWLCHS